MNNIDKNFNLSISLVKSIDTYIRNIDLSNIDDYQEYYPFISEIDILLYNDIDKSSIINYTISIMLSSKIDIKNQENILYVCIVSYILSLKYISDCAIYKPYSFLINFIEDFAFEDIRNILFYKYKKYKYNKAYKKILKRMIKIESKILSNTNFFSKNEI
jgi:hypothetical protein